MLEFDCPACGEPLEISDRMAGRRVRCLGCDETIEVPDESLDCVRGVRSLQNQGLSGTEFFLFTLLFFFIPAANVWVSSILYYVWRRSRPRRANQINLLGFAVFGIHVLLVILLVVMASRR